jgi:uncharacterized membrane protein
VANDTPVHSNRIERILAFVIGGVAGLSILAIVAVVIANLTGADLSGGVWPAVTVLPLIGLTVALVLIVVFTVLRVTRLRRDGDAA